MQHAGDDFVLGCEEPVDPAAVERAVSVAAPETVPVDTDHTKAAQARPQRWKVTLRGQRVGEIEVDVLRCHCAHGTCEAGVDFVVVEASTTAA